MTRTALREPLRKSFGENISPRRRPELGSYHRSCRSKWCAHRTEEFSLSIGDSTIYTNENWQGHNQERRAHEIMKAARYTMTITLGLGTKQAAVLMSDLSAEYVKINSDYRS